METPYVILIACVSLLAGCFLGWMACNSRWIDASKYGDSVQVRGKFYYTIDPNKWGNK